MNPKVLVSTLCCDRKAYSQAYALEAISKLTYDNFEVYVNVQTPPADGNDAMWGPMDAIISEIEKQRHVYQDFWEWLSSWAGKPQFDQDQARLAPICIARNMTLMAMMATDASFLLMVDADVAIPSDAIERMVRHNAQVLGGVVPGRQEHKHATYVTRPSGRDISGLLRVDYSTCGFLMLRRDVCNVMRFRHGESIIKKGTQLSEDPAFSEDMQAFGFGPWYVDEKLKATHMDDPTPGSTLGEVQY